MNTFPKTHEALAVYDAADAAYDAESDRLTVGQCHNRLCRLDKLGEAVGIAFAHDTADINSFSSASVVRPGPWLRGLLENTSNSPS